MRDRTTASRQTMFEFGLESRENCWVGPYKQGCKLNLQKTPNCARFSESHRRINGVSGSGQVFLRHLLQEESCSLADWYRCSSQRFCSGHHRMWYFQLLPGDQKFLCRWVSIVLVVIFSNNSGRPEVVVPSWTYVAISVVGVYARTRDAELREFPCPDAGGCCMMRSVMVWGQAIGGKS